MKKVLCTLFLFALTSALFAPTASASIIAYYRGTFVNSNEGSDSLGLDGASFEFAVGFDCDARYIDRFGLPVVDSFAHYLAIGGSGGADGFYAEADEIGFYPTFIGQYFGGGAGNGAAEFSIGSTTLFMGNLVTEVGGVSIGDLIDVSHFGTTLQGLGFLHFFEGDTTYNVDNFSAEIIDDCGVVPEPGTIAIWSVLAATGLVVSKRRRQVA